MSDVAEAVTALFVPADRPDRYAKAAAAGPDLVIIDLEDAVAALAKSAARATVVDALRPGSDAQRRAMVRVNAATTPWFADDVGALLDLVRHPAHGLVGVMLPKAEDPDVLGRLAAGLAERARGPVPALVPLIESAAGVVRASELARVEGVTRLGFGGLDFSLDVDAELESVTVDWARAHIVIAARAAGIASPMDSPSTEIADTRAVAAAARAARAAGFGGQLCIHPHQVAPVRNAFVPSAIEVAWARSVVDAGDGAVQVEGRMVDRPVLERARRLLRRAR